MAQRTCSIDGCEKKHHSRGFCNTHYVEKRRAGSLGPALVVSPEQRFWSKVEKTDGCWNWIGKVSSSGYGRFSIAKSKTVAAHRVSFEMHYGFMPGEDIDHQCSNRICVNPAHLRPATRKQNLEHQSRLRSDNSSGYRGVDQHSGGWRARVEHHGKKIQVGIFLTAHEAAEAARLKRNELFTHNDRDRIA